MKEEAGLMEKTDQAMTLWEACVCGVNSPSHAYAMQKAKAPGSGGTKEKRGKIMLWDHEQQRTKWVRDPVCAMRHFQTPIYSCKINDDTMVELSTIKAEIVFNLSHTIAVPLVTVFIKIN